MFNTTKLALAAALAVVIPFTSFSANAADLETLTKTNWQDTVKKSTKPVLLLVTGANCKACDVLEAVLKTSADTHSDVKFIKVDANDVGVPAEELPYVAYSYPSVGITVTGPSRALKTEADVSKALNVWSASAVETSQLKATYGELKKKVDADSAPYEEQAKQLRAKKKEATKDVYQSYNAVRAQLEAKAKPYDEQIAKLEAEREKALADTQQQLEQARDVIETAEKPFDEEYAKLRETASAAVSATQNEMDKVSKALRRLKAKDQLLLNNYEE